MVLARESVQRKMPQELRERVVESFLDFLILNLLAKNPSVSSEGLINLIQQKVKVALSSGILHSHLFHLERDGTILRDYIKNNKVYRITQKGKEKIELAKKHKDATQWVIDQMFEE